MNHQHILLTLLFCSLQEKRGRPVTAELYRLNKNKDTGMLDLGAPLNVLAQVMLSQEAETTITPVGIMVHTALVSPQILFR